ncbi:MAG: hypothetical protein R3B45_03815 [Bdellovibrionota bacterium]
MTKYWEFIKIEFQQGMQYRGAALAKMGFYGLVLFIFSRLWKVVAIKTTLSMPAKDMLWYLAMTELIVLSFPLIHLEIEEDVRTGNLAYFLTKPTSYMWSRYARGLGSVFSKLLFLIFAGLFFAYLFSGGFPEKPLGLLLFLPLLIISIAVYLLFQMSIGVSSFWIQDCSPVYWVWQKMSFILGGMILPLDIYPSWLKSIAMNTPFASLLYEPVKAALTLDVNLAFGVAFKLFLWGLLAIFLLSLIYKKACKQLVLNGG